MLAACPIPCYYQFRPSSSSHMSSVKCSNCTRKGIPCDAQQSKRAITYACQACKKHKIKCNLVPKANPDLRGNQRDQQKVALRARQEDQPQVGLTHSDTSEVDKDQINSPSVSGDSGFIGSISSHSTPGWAETLKQPEPSLEDFFDVSGG